MAIVKAFINLNIRDKCEVTQGIRKIQKLNQDPEQCHHLRVSLETEDTRELLNPKTEVDKKRIKKLKINATRDYNGRKKMLADRQLKTAPAYKEIVIHDDEH